jgi:hypothetical protein
MSSPPTISKVTKYGNAASFWVEYPSGHIDLSRTVHPQEGELEPPKLQSSQLDISVDGDRIIRINKATTAAVIIDMQKSVVDFYHFLNVDVLTGLLHLAFFCILISGPTPRD